MFLDEIDARVGRCRAVILEEQPVVRGSVDYTFAPDPSNSQGYVLDRATRSIIDQFLELPQVPCQPRR